MKKLLLADDSVTIQRVVKLSFAGEDIEVSAVDSGDAAVRVVEELQPDIVLADVYMPGRNGFSVCEYVKSSPRLGHIPVILLVGIFEPFDQDEASRVRYDGVLTKPFETAQLLDMVGNLLAQRAATGPAASTAVPQDLQDDLLEQAAGEPWPEDGAVLIQEADVLEELDGESPATACVKPAFKDEEGSLEVLEACPAETPDSGFAAVSVVSVSDGAAATAFLGDRAPASWWRVPTEAEVLDDDAILEIDYPQVAEEAEIEPTQAPAIEPVAERGPASVGHPATATPGPSAVPAPEELSPRVGEAAPIVRPAEDRAPAVLSAQDIESIVDLVVRRISDRVVKEIAWEVVPELAETLIREQLERRSSAGSAPGSGR